MIRIKKALVFLLLTITPWAYAAEDVNNNTKPYNQGINITPHPAELKVNEGEFLLNENTQIVAQTPEANKIALFFAAKMKRSTSLNLKTIHKKEKGKENYINLTINPKLDTNKEGYTLTSTSNGVDIVAKTPQGLFYGMQTFMQLFPAEIESPSLVKNIKWAAPSVSIKDEPRFKYRGMHLDICRHFNDVDFIKKQLDVLSLFKINILHWHLTEDQAWRIEIKKYPKLTEIGGKRIEGDGSQYGPFFYTQEQVKEVVAYAKERFIEVIPEIELPGHGVAALSAYPEYSCTGKPIDVRNYWGVASDVYCAGNDATFQFLEDIIGEVIPLFESDYFHIGGDECPKDRWEKCPKCQARIKKLGLEADDNHTAEEKLQSYFVQRIEKFLNKNNKKMIGWDEILEGGLAESATVMSWRGEQGGITSANMGHDVIMTPGDYLYLDHYQGDEKLLPVTIGGYTPLKKTYSYDPVPKDIQKDKVHHILGAQANIWSEYKYNDMDKEHDIYPRLLALAELTWTPLDKKDYADFERRMDNQRVRLDMHNINYYIPTPEDKNAPSCNHIAFIDKAQLEFKTTEPAKIVYTLDGTEPNLSSKVYSPANPLIFTKDATIKTRSILSSNKMGKVRTINVEKQSYLPAVKKESTSNGLEAKYYKGVARTLSDLINRKPFEVESVSTPQASKYRIEDYKEIYNEDFCSTVLTGYINIPEDGIYYFNTDQELWIGENFFITNKKETDTSRRFSGADKSIALAKGYHPITIVRYGATFGGWPTQWENIRVSIRKDGEKEFKTMGAEYFK